ncbi:Fumarylpyruvate hydrolase [Pelagimonas phthalicica]|uniref:Fumarylpyruvate hydrolase n=1 Tax=Pelagimonas phthalicica TaxID=1037362 RepID=A0A238JEH5_9RHOB|nr:fumarylacetoacetate hydrolase family protein [Pelagimonas phthalicica]TDS92030.1 fumarylpyruvate hydrolase [Pelagimonas phthalicica]SMX29080.1 Fumarylpyruvate hydrolase [Pelagimonas phthalicica]
MAFEFEPASRPALPILGRETVFPVRRIFCVGRNYAAHAREMGKDPDREPPFFFTKPADAIITPGPVPYPPLTQDLHYEAELVVCLGQGGRNIAQAAALDHVFGYAVGNDLTRRDLQAEAKKMGRPWDMAKGFDSSAVIGPIGSVDKGGHLEQGAITLSVNGTEKQRGDLSQMIWSIPEVISILSTYVELAAGDLIMTGTPAGVGALVPGDQCTISIEGLPDLEMRMTG